MERRCDTLRALQQVCGSQGWSADRISAGLWRGWQWLAHLGGGVAAGQGEQSVPLSPGIGGVACLILCLPQPRSPWCVWEKSGSLAW